MSDDSNIIIDTGSGHAKSKTSRGLVYAICAVASLLFIGIIIWVVSTLGKPTLGDDFFVSNDEKTTINISSTSPDTTATHQTYVVYDYDDNDNVIAMKTYFEYPDADSAATAYESLKYQPEFKDAELSDKYIIVASDESQFKGLTASDVRQQAEAIKQYNESRKASEESKDSTEE